MKLKNKILVILSIFAILITCVCSSAFAYDIGVSKDITYKIPDDLSSHAYKWIYSGVYRYNNSGCHAYTYVATSDSPISIELGEKTNDNGWIIQKIKLHSDSEIYFVRSGVNTSYKEDYLNAPYRSDLSNSEIYEYSKDPSGFSYYYCDSEKTSYGYSNFDVKEIAGLDENLSKEKMDLARWMARKYFCNLSNKTKEVNLCNYIQIFYPSLWKNNSLSF